MEKEIRFEFDAVVFDVDTETFLRTNQKFVDLINKQIATSHNIWLVSNCHKEYREFRESIHDVIFYQNIGETILVNIPNNCLVTIKIENQCIELHTEPNYYVEPNNIWKYEHNYYIYPLAKEVKNINIGNVDFIDNYIANYVL